MIALHDLTFLISLCLALVNPAVSTSKEAESTFGPELENPEAVEKDELGVADEAYEQIEDMPMEDFDADMIPAPDFYGNYDCLLCDKTFSTRNGLNGHVWVHRKPYCALCRTFLANEAIYEDHKQRLHSGRAPEMCHLCGKEFLHGSRLIVHLRSHKKQNTYRCSDPECNETFMTKLECIKHLKLCEFADLEPPRKTRRVSPKKRAIPSSSCASRAQARLEKNIGIQKYVISQD